MQRHRNKSPPLTLLLRPLVLDHSQPSFLAEHLSHPVCVFSGCSPANSQDSSSTSHCPNWAGLLDSLKWCWCFHFHLQITVVVAVFWWSEQSKREKREMLFGFGLLTFTSISQSQHPDHTVPEYRMHYFYGSLSHSLFLLPNYEL